MLSKAITTKTVYIPYFDEHAADAIKPGIIGGYWHIREIPANTLVKVFKGLYNGVDISYHGIMINAEDMFTTWADAETWLFDIHYNKNKIPAADLLKEV